MSWEGTTMLHKMRNWAWRLRCGVMASAIIVSLAIPVTASASTRAATYVNLANAISLRSGSADFTLKFQLQQSSASTVNAVNRAVASTSKCHNCGAVAIGFQILVVAKQNLAALNADNTANATSFDCVRCSTLAAAYQIISVSDSQPLTGQQEQDLNRIRAEVEALRNYGLETDQIQSRAGQLANQAVSILQDGAGTAPAALAPAFPAINGSALPAQLAESNQPVVKLFIKTQNLTG
jgi:hypothetical protein